jgi:hypothetical protein
MPVGGRDGVGHHLVRDRASKAWWHAGIAVFDLRTRTTPVATTCSATRAIATPEPSQSKCHAVQVVLL